MRRLVGEGRWLLVYGRRKTGKTWLLRRCIGWELYATVSTGASCILEERGGGVRLVSVEECVRVVFEAVRDGGSVVVDEFQRLPSRYWDVFQVAAAGGSEARLVLCASSLGIARRVFDRRSPLLGLVEPVRIDLVDFADAVASLLEAGLGDREAILWAVVARDPWILAHVRLDREPWVELSEAAARIAPVARGLVGEVFEEEERQLTRVYEAVLSLLAEGYWRASDIAAKLAEAGLVSSDSPGVATGILNVLSDIGLVEKVPLWRTRRARVYYRHRSSALALLYRVLDQVEELGLPPSPEQVRSAYGVELQFNVGELLAAARGLRRGYSIQPDGRDIDVVLLDRRGVAHWGYEVKMGEADARDVDSFAEYASRLGVRRVGYVALEGVRGEPSLIDEVLDAEGLAKLAVKVSRARRETLQSS